VHRLEQPRECGRAFFHPRIIPGGRPLTCQPAAGAWAYGSERSASTSSRWPHGCPARKRRRHAFASRHARRPGRPLMSCRAVPTP
jgi:hypothetical protein